MKYRVLLLGVCVLTAGCGHHPLTDYRPLDRAGMWSSSLEQLKALDTSAHEHKHPFVSGESSANLIAAGYSESQVLEIARADKLDSLSGDLVALRLIGLSDSTLEFVLRRRLEGRPTMSSAAIARLKNTGLSEQQIVERIKQGETEAQAEQEATNREIARNHAGTGFVRIHGRKR
jgi:hypothetical protein